MTTDRRVEATHLAEELLTNIELEELPALSIVRKATRLARLLNDVDALEWLTTEAVGYDSSRTDNQISQKAFKHAVRSGRDINGADGKRVVTTGSVAQLQSAIESYKLRLASAADAPVSITSANPNQYVNASRGNTQERGAITDAIVEWSHMLNKVMANVHKYVADKAYELRFGSAVETSINRLRSVVDRQVSELIPEALPKLTAALELVESDNSEHWADAAGYCRKLIKAVADQLQPPGSEIGGRANGEGQYVNRLIYWIQFHESSKTMADAIASDLEYFGRRLDAFTDAGNKGAHTNVSQYDADRFILGTYILIADILRLRDASSLAGNEEHPSTAKTTTGSSPVNENRLEQGLVTSP